MSKIENRSAKVLPGGRAEHRADIVAGGTTVPWVCACSPGEHDHDAIHRKYIEGLEARGAVVGDLNALVGHTGRKGLLRYTITDCNIQIHGPAKYVLYVAWTEEPLTGEWQNRHEWTQESSRPATLPKADLVLSLIDGWLADHGTAHAKAIRQAGGFVSP